MISEINRTTFALPGQRQVTIRSALRPRRAAQGIFVLLGTSAVALASFSASASEALAEKYGCAACHQVAQKVVGPSWKDVQGKYAGKLTPAQLAASVKAGSSGKWGAIPMPPQAAVPDQDLVALATWILEATK